jgi:hypothetical protein
VLRARRSEREVLDRLLGAAVREGESRVVSQAESGAYRCCTCRSTVLVTQPPVGCDERAGTELEAAAAGAERSGVHAVVSDRVEEPCVTAAFAAGSSPAIGRALRSIAPSGRASERRCQYVMLLNTLTTFAVGRCCCSFDPRASLTIVLRRVYACTGSALCDDRFVAHL